jgi:hypothetical protein
MMRIMNDNLKGVFLCTMSSARSRQPSPERRLARVEKLRRPVPDPPDPRMFVIATLVRLPGSLSGDRTKALIRTLNNA